MKNKKFLAMLLAVLVVVSVFAVGSLAFFVDSKSTGENPREDATEEQQEEINETEEAIADAEEALTSGEELTEEQSASISAAANALIQKITATSGTVIGTSSNGTAISVTKGLDIQSTKNSNTTTYTIGLTTTDRSSTSTTAVFDSASINDMKSYVSMASTGGEAGSAGNDIVLELDIGNVTLDFAALSALPELGETDNLTFTTILDADGNPVLIALVNGKRVPNFAVSVVARPVVDEGTDTGSSAA